MTDNEFRAKVGEIISEGLEHLAEARKQRWCEYYCLLWHYGRGSNASLTML